MTGFGASCRVQGDSKSAASASASGRPQSATPAARPPFKEIKWSELQFDLKPDIKGRGNFGFAERAR